MGRTITFEVPTDTSLFNPLQLQPRAVCTLAMVGWARWLREHWVPFPRLIDEHNLGVVILGLDVEYRRPFGFFDADTLVAVASLGVGANGALLVQETRISPPEGPDVACVTALLRPVSIADGVVLSATPTSLGNDQLARFDADEFIGDPPRRRLRTVLGELESGDAPLAATIRTFTLHRHLCEAADQWSGIALPDLTTQVREHLVSANGVDVAALAVGLTRPMRRLTMEFRRPVFFLDEFTVACEAYDARDETIFVHRFVSASDAELLATVVEWFPNDDARERGTSP